jgi:GNAT superfamily N-acetyltransferase
MEDTGLIRPCKKTDFEEILAIINDAAQAYRKVIPGDRWNDPYMSWEELAHEIDDGIVFWGYEELGEILGVIGVQDKGDVTLIRHAYVRTRKRNQGIGSKLLRYLEREARSPILVGTWADADWAIGFYQKHGYRLVSMSEKDRLLRTYWSIPERQIETSVVLADGKMGV